MDAPKQTRQKVRNSVFRPVLIENFEVTARMEINRLKGDWQQTLCKTERYILEKEMNDI